MDDVLWAYVQESNRIEGIHRAPTKAEVEATLLFLECNKPGVADVEALVDVLQPGARLRLNPTQNVQVGSHIAPQGGPEIGSRLAKLLDGLPVSDPWETHVEYETLHPFMDGNGRSGRAIWAWQMVRRYGERGLGIGFLHRFYYQTLERWRPPTE